MAITDIISVSLSAAAVVVSIITFYLQRIRKSDKLIVRLLCYGVSDAVGWSDEAQYSMSNLGDTQVAITRVDVLNSSQESQQFKADGVPFVLKPNDIVVLTVFYNTNSQKDPHRLVVWVTSATGKTYMLVDDIGKFETLDLQNTGELDF